MRPSDVPPRRRLRCAAPSWPVARGPANRVRNLRKYGWTALHFATEYGHLECARLLVRARAGRTKKNKLGHTALELAQQQGLRTVVALLEQPVFSFGPQAVLKAAMAASCAVGSCHAAEAMASGG